MEHQCGLLFLCSQVKGLLSVSNLDTVCTRPEGGNFSASVLSAHTVGHQAKCTCSLSPSAGASQADRKCRKQRYVPVAHHLQRL